MPHRGPSTAPSKKRAANSPVQSTHGRKRRREDVEVVHVDSSLPAAISRKQTRPGRAEPQHPGPSHERNQVKPLPEIELLKAELVAKTKIVEAQKATLQQLQSHLTCQICLDILNHPFAIVPCGHVSCFHCLQSWFRQPRNPDDHGPARAKTCPHCRVVVTTPPIALYILKSVISLVHSIRDPERASLPPSRPPTPANAWDDLFPLNPPRIANRPIVDHDDGGVNRCEFCLFEIWDGECTGCGRLYDLDEEDSDEGDPSQSGEDEGSSEDSFIDDADPSFPQMQLFDIGAHYDPGAISREETPEHDQPIVMFDSDDSRGPDAMSPGEEAFEWSSRRRTRLVVDTDDETEGRGDHSMATDDEESDNSRNEGSEDRESTASDGSGLCHSDEGLHDRQF